MPPVNSLPARRRVLRFAKRPSSAGIASVKSLKRSSHPDPPGVGADGEAAPGRDPHALRLARRQSGPPGEPRRCGAGPEARRHQGGDAIDTGALVGLRDRALLSVMLYSFARVSAVLGMRRQDYFGQASRGWLRLHEKGGKRHDSPGPSSGVCGPRRLPRGGGARGAEGGAVPERGPGWAPADGAGARAAGGPGDDQASGRGRGAPVHDLLPHVPGDGDHGVLGERRDAGARAADRGACLAEDDEALRPHGGHRHRRRDRTYRHLNEDEEYSPESAGAPSCRQPQRARRCRVPPERQRQPALGEPFRLMHHQRPYPHVERQPVTVSLKARSPPTSMPAPVSASPPSRRTPTSMLGLKRQPAAAEGGSPASPSSAVRHPRHRRLGGVQPGRPGPRRGRSPRRPTARRP